MVNAPPIATTDSAWPNRPAHGHHSPAANGLNTTLTLTQPIAVWRAKFTTDPTPADNIFGRPFGEKRRQRIVRSNSVESSHVELTDLGPDHVLVLELGTSEADLTTLQKIQHWLDHAADPNDATAAQWVSLPGTQLVWHPRCLVVSATPERSERVCQAALEVMFFAAELQFLEAAVDNAWDSTLEDAPLGFEFSTADLPRRSILAQRFQSVCELRTRYARLISQVIVPHVYPPTIASQISERLRERLRLEDRLELTDERLTAQESVYERCSQRCSDFVVARTGHHLEWIIIILLAFQTILWIVDLLSASNGVPPTTP